MEHKFNMSKPFDDGGWAIYLPAMSSFYIKQIANAEKNEDFHKKERVPDTFEHGIGGLDFLRKENSYYHYSYGLYSAGHAQLDLTKAKEEEAMVHTRNRDDTMILGDSGGFQVAKGIIKLDWTNAKDPNDPARLALCDKILTWLESTSDWSMTLDIPGFAYEGTLGEKTGLKNFQDTLDISILNLDYFMKNRTPGKTKFLNVISGSSAENGRVWYEGVKKYSNPAEVSNMGYDVNKTLEGFAFAGIHMKNMYVTLERLLNLRDDGLLEGKDWIHFLGIGRLDWACFLTIIQRELRKHDNPNITLSFDAASPFVCTAYGQCYHYNYFTNKKFIYKMSPAIDRKDLEGDHTQMPFGSPITNRLTLHDMCPLSEAHALVEGEHRYDVNAEEVKALADAGIDATWIEERTNKLGNTARTGWDTLSYLFYMSHNVYKHIEAVAEANRIADVEYKRTKPSWRNWIKDKKSSNTNELSQFVPHTILFFTDFVKELFDPNTKDPYALLEENKAFLEMISFGSKGKNVFTDLFDQVDDVDEDGIDKFADMNDNKLMELELDENPKEK